MATLAHLHKTAVRRALRKRNCDVRRLDGSRMRPYRTARFAALVRSRSQHEENYAPRSGNKHTFFFSFNRIQQNHVKAFSFFLSFVRLFACRNLKERLCLQQSKKIMSMTTETGELFCRDTSLATRTASDRNGKEPWFADVQILSNTLDDLRVWDVQRWDSGLDATKVRL
jgi:hypothetical protein